MEARIILAPALNAVQLTVGMIAFNPDTMERDSLNAVTETDADFFIGGINKCQQGEISLPDNVVTNDYTVLNIQEMGESPSLYEGFASKILCMLILIGIFKVFKGA